MAAEPSEFRWEIYLAAAPEDAQCASALYAALRKGGARVFWEERAFEPGEDRKAAQERALRSADIGLFVLSRATRSALDVRSDIAAALQACKDDLTRRVIPVHCDDHAKNVSLYGTNILVELNVASEGGEEAVARRVLALVAKHRAQSKLRPRIAVVAVMEELSAAQHAIVQRLRAVSQRPEVSEIDAAEPQAFAQACKHDYYLVLVGGRTGGTDALERLVRGGAACIKASAVDLSKCRAKEMAAAMAIWDSVQESFASPEEASQLALEHFANWLKHRAPPGPGHEAALEPWEADYLRTQKDDQWGKGTYRGLQAYAKDRRLNRAQLYVSLRAVAKPTCYANEKEELFVLPEDSAEQRAPHSEEEKEKHRNPFLERVLSHPGLPHLAIEGEAGSGKTVLLQHTAYVLASRHLGETPPTAQLDEATLSAGAPLLRIPILMDAKQLAELIPHGYVDELIEALASLVGKTVAAKKSLVTADAIRVGLCAGRYLLLIDSLDEVPSGEDRRRILDCLNAFVQLGDFRSRLVLTSRPMAHTGVSLSESRLRMVRIAPLEREQVELMAARWFDAIGADAGYKKDLLGALQELEHRHPPVGEESTIPQNPQLLTCAFLVFDQQKLLPDKPVVLFGRMVRILCDARPSQDFPAERKRQVLEQVFECIQRAGGTECDARQVAESLTSEQIGVKRTDDALDLLERLASETGLLRFDERRGDRGEIRSIARPSHRSFEEYLCACRLAFAPGSVTEETDKLVGTADEPGVLLNESWEGVVTFLFGVYVVERGNKSDEAYVERLLRRGQGCLGPVPPRRRGRILGVAARCLAETRDSPIAPSLRDELRHEIAARFREEGASWLLRDRLLALEALGRLGDPRLGGDPWVEIQGGSFTMGGDPEAYSSPAQTVTVAPFRMMWRPITVQDYKAFVDGGGYAEDELWEAGRPEANEKEPDEWHSQGFHPNRPVTGVSWFEAMAFCRWASGAWGLEVDLPSEAEWEFAARGREGRPYPWGEEEPGEGDGARANYELQIGHPTPVGAFPSGNCGSFVDMAGNVMEWCHDEWSEQGSVEAPAAASSRGAWRGVRGGAWYGFPRYLRCASRLSSPPEVRRQHLGFRVVCRGSRQP